MKKAIKITIGFLLFIGGLFSGFIFVFLSDISLAIKVAGIFASLLTSLLGWLLIRRNSKNVWETIANIAQFFP